MATSTDGVVRYSDDWFAQRPQREADLATLDAAVEQVIGQERHYGIRVWPEAVPGRDLPTWRLTDPHKGREGYALGWWSTEPPAVEVYTREQYVRACAAVGLAPADDADLGTYADMHMSASLDNLTALEHCEATLRRRRMAGVERDRAAQWAAHDQALAEAGLVDGPLDRADYERACVIAGVRRPVDDDRAAALYDTEGALAQRGQTGRMVAVALASRRGQHIRVVAPAPDPRCCDECGTPIRSAGMTASLGLACDVGCYDAMSDRPGRYATHRR